MSALNCIKCYQEFSSEITLPLVLPCGDSVCMKCLLFLSSQPQSFLKCPDCSLIFEVNNFFIKSLPKNKAIISLINSRNPALRSGPIPKVLFANTPEPKKISASPNKSFSFYTPSTYHSPIPFSSPNSVAMKCARTGCMNDRYYLNGEIWEYCCINCKNADGAGFRN